MNRLITSAIEATEMLLKDVHDGKNDMTEVKIGQLRNQLHILQYAVEEALLEGKIRCDSKWEE